MKFDTRRVYLHAVLGALGGLIGWLLTVPVTFLSEWMPDGVLGLFIADTILGTLVGLSVGTVIGSYEGVFVSRRILRWLRGAFLGGLLGGLGGALGLVLSEGIFLLGGGGVWPRALGWALFGLLVGVAQGIAQWSWSKIGYGALGGLLGGLVGGSTYERLSVIVLRLTPERNLGLSLGGALGLTLLGAVIGGLIGLVEVMLRSCWLTFTRGPLEGQTFTLDGRKARHVIGSARSCDLVLPGDPDVEPRHAVIKHEGGEFTIAPLEGTVLLREPLGYTPVQQTVLSHKKSIQLGKTRFVLHIAGERAEPIPLDVPQRRGSLQ